MQYELVLLTFLPLLGALAIVFTPKGAERLQRLVALATTLVVAALGVRLFLAFGDGESVPGRFLFAAPWFSLPTASSCAAGASCPRRRQRPRRVRVWAGSPAGGIA